MVKGVLSKSSSSSVDKNKILKTASQNRNSKFSANEENKTSSVKRKLPVLEKKLQIKQFNVLVVRSKTSITSADGVSRYTDVIIKLIITNMVAGDREVKLFNGDRPFYGNDEKKHKLNMDELISYQLPVNVLLANLEHRNQLTQKRLKYLCPIDIFQALPISLKARKAIPSLRDEGFAEVDIQKDDIVFSFIITPRDGALTIENSRRLLGKILVFVIFLLIIKSKWYYSLPVFLLLVIDQSLKVHSEFLKSVNKDDPNIVSTEKIRKTMSYIIYILIIMGFIAYGIRQYYDYGMNFSWIKLLFYSSCKNIPQNYK
jgi:hypothetical protein